MRAQEIRLSSLVILGRGEVAQRLSWLQILRKVPSKRPAHGAPRGDPHSMSKLDAGPRLAIAEVGARASSRCTAPLRGVVHQATMHACLGVRCRDPNLAATLCGTGAPDFIRLRAVIYVIFAKHVIYACGHPSRRTRAEPACSSG